MSNIRKRLDVKDLGDVWNWAEGGKSDTKLGSPRRKESKKAVKAEG